MTWRLASWYCAATVLFTALCVGCGSGEKAADGGKSTAGSKRFIFIANGDDPYWDAANAGLIKAAEDLKLKDAGFTVVMEKNNGTAQGQIDKLRQFASQSDVAGIALSAIQADNAAIAEEMKNLIAKGVKVITVDADINTQTFPDARPYYIGTNNVVAGQILGKAAKELLNSRGAKEGGYVQFAGFTDNDNARNRMNGVKEAITEQYTERDRMADEMDRSRARDNVRNALNNHKDLVALVGIWAYNAPAIAEVVQERKVHDKVAVVTFDAQPVAIENMAAGQIDAMIVQNPFDMGYQSVRLLNAMIHNDDKTIAEMFPNAGQPGGDVFTTGLRLVVPDKETTLKPELFDAKVVEVMPLSQFQDWLKKYNLTGS